ncbi:hypothetical protein [Sphingomonas profundi]|uniref:hypothetical protein n=1 Tax=Alterirhizorhabdus profundi TaxID=2681549 RepID=UPI0012E7FAE1|nr:hypothetical protein [Sphingomonas profundi]
MAEHEPKRGEYGEAPTSAGVATADPAKIWTPDPAPEPIRPNSPADAALAGIAPADAPAEPDDDPQSGSGDMPSFSADPAKPDTGADASSHGSR